MIFRHRLAIPVVFHILAIELAIEVALHKSVIEGGGVGELVGKHAGTQGKSRNW